MTAIEGQAPRKTLAQKLGTACAAAAGWRVAVAERPPERCVYIGAPHTSNWDWLLTLTVMLVTGLRFQWVAKDSLFRWPLGSLMRKLGGVALDRSISHNFVEQMVAAFGDGRLSQLAITPEGTRSKVEGWRTGFYFIALGAGVPVVMAYADYPRKVAGLGPCLTLSGDIEADFAEIRKFYGGITGRFPHKQGDVRPRPRSDRQ